MYEKVWSLLSNNNIKFLAQGQWLLTRDFSHEESQLKLGSYSWPCWNLVCVLSVNHLKSYKDSEVLNTVVWSPKVCYKRWWKKEQRDKCVWKISKWAVSLSKAFLASSTNIKNFNVNFILDLWMWAKNPAEIHTYLCVCMFLNTYESNTQSTKYGTVWGHWKYLLLAAFER